jgi:amidase
MSTKLVESRTMRDTAAVLDCLGRPQPGDPFVIKQPIRPYLEELDAPTKPVRVAFSARPLMLDRPVNPETVAALERTAALLEGMGHTVIEATPVFDVNEAILHSPNVYFVGFARYVDSLAEEMRREVGTETLEPCTLAIYEASKKIDAHAMIDAFSYYNTVRREFGRFFERHDIWLTPTTAQPSEPWGNYGQDLEGLSSEEYMAHIDAAVQFCVPYNITGFPSISMPLEETSDALPIGIQLGARHGEEDLLIRMGRDLEQALPWRKRIPPVHVSRL